MSSKRKIVSKKKTSNKFGLISQKIRQPKYHEVFMVVNGKVDKTIKARFTKDEIKRMQARKKRFSLKIDKSDVGLAISSTEWDNLDERNNWDEYQFITKSGKKIRLLANFKESDKGITRSDPFWKPRKREVIDRPGQMELQL